MLPQIEEGAAQHLYHEVVDGFRCSTTVEFVGEGGKGDKGKGCEGGAGGGGGESKSKGLPGSSIMTSMASAAAQLFACWDEATEEGV